MRACTRDQARLKSAVPRKEQKSKRQSRQDRLNNLYALITFSLVLELPSNNYGKPSLVIRAKPRPAGGGRSPAGDRPGRWRRKNVAGAALGRNEQHLSPQAVMTEAARCISSPSLQAALCRSGSCPLGPRRSEPCPPAAAGVAREANLQPTERSASHYQEFQHEHSPKHRGQNLIRVVVCSTFRGN